MPAFRINNTQCGGTQWARQLANGDLAVLILNRDADTMATRLDFADLPGGAEGAGEQTSCVPVLFHACGRGGLVVYSVSSICDVGRDRKTYACCQEADARTS